MRKNKGITLIALIITIIVMLILVGVVVTVVIQSDLLGTAKNTGDMYKTAYEEESSISGVTINGKDYNSIEEYMKEINQVIVEPKNIDDWIYKLEDDGTITITRYKGTDKEVVIPNYINGLPVKKIDSGIQHSLWDESICSSERKAGYIFVQDNITKVVISDGIEKIESNYTFCASQALTKVIIPTSVKTIAGATFYYCTLLTEIAIPSSVTTMGSGVFRSIPSITVHVPWKEGEKPEGWNDYWNDTDPNCTITVDYAK